jgi:hypothetical protein
MDFFGKLSKVEFKTEKTFQLCSSFYSIEPQFREKILEKRNKQIGANLPDDQQKYTYDIMISYCYADRDIVYRIQRFLINEGYHIWFDPNLNHGQGETIK